MEESDDPVENLAQALGLEETVVRSPKKRKFLEPLENSSSDENEKPSVSVQQSINSISALFTPEEPKTRLLLPKVSNKTERNTAIISKKPSTSTFSAVKLEPTSKKQKVDPFEQYYTRCIPRTGIEQPFLIDPPFHIRRTQDLERTNEISQNLKMNILEDYRIRETGRIVNLAKTVYDVERDSPHYKNTNEYVDPSK